MTNFRPSFWDNENVPGVQALVIIIRKSISKHQIETRHSLNESMKVGENQYSIFI